MGIHYQTKFPVLEAIDKTRKALEDEALKTRFATTQPGVRFWPSQGSMVISRTDEFGEQIKEIKGTCLRAAYYQCMNVEPTERVGSRVYNAADIGNIVEDRYAEWMNNLWKEGFEKVYPNMVGRKLKFKRGHMSGEADIVIRHIETDTLIGIEMKSYDGAMNAIGLVGYFEAKKAYGPDIRYVRKYLDKSRKKPNPDFYKTPSPKDDHLIQAMIYLDNFKEMGIELWKIIYIARDKAPPQEFDIELTKYLGKTCPVVNGVVRPDWTLESIYKRYDLLKEYIDKNGVPPPDYVNEYDPDVLLDDEKTPKWVKDKVKGGETHRDWRCNYCDFLSKCIDDGETVI